MVDLSSREDKIEFFETEDAGIARVFGRRFSSFPSMGGIVELPVTPKDGETFGKNYAFYEEIGDIFKEGASYYVDTNNGELGADFTNEGGEECSVIYRRIPDGIDWQDFLGWAENKDDFKSSVLRISEPVGNEFLDIYDKYIPDIKVDVDGAFADLDNNVLSAPVSVDPVFFAYLNMPETTTAVLHYFPDYKDVFLTAFVSYDPAGEREENIVRNLPLNVTDAFVSALEKAVQDKYNMSVQEFLDDEKEKYDIKNEIAASEARESRRGV